MNKFSIVIANDNEREQASAEIDCHNIYIESVVSIIDKMAEKRKN